MAFGCGTPEAVLLIPFRDFAEWLGDLNVTDTDDRFYWHVIFIEENEELTLHRRGGLSRIDVKKYLLE